MEYQLWMWMGHFYTRSINYYASLVSKYRFHLSHLHQFLDGQLGLARITSHLQCLSLVLLVVWIICFVF